MCALLKVAVFRAHVLQSASLDILDSCFAMFPLEGDPFESRETHNLFMDLLCDADSRLIGSEYELLPTCLLMAAQLQAGFYQALEEIESSGGGMAEEDEFWESQCVRRTYGAKFEHLISQLPRHIDIGILQSIMAELPEEASSMYSF